MRVWILTLLVGTALAAPGFFGQERSIKDFLENFAKEAGIIELLPWMQEKIKSDPDSQRIIDFFKGKRWTNIKDHLKACPTYETINAQLQKEGIDLTELLEKIKTFVVGESRFQARRPLGEHMNDFFEKINLDNILVLLQEKIKNDPDMGKIVAFLNSEDSKSIEDCMNQSEDVQDLLEELLDEGIDVKKLVDMFKVIFGVTYYQGRRSVADMLHELVHQTGVDELLGWIQEMLKNDPSVQRIVEFFKGNEWSTLKEQVQKCPDYKMIKEKLKGEGIDVDKLLEDIRNFVIGTKNSRFASRNSLGELLNDALTKLDIDKILIVVMDKLDNDPEMKKLVEFIKGDGFKAIVECMKSSQQVQDLLEELKDEGIDVVRLVHVLKAIFGDDDDD